MEEGEDGPMPEADRLQLGSEGSVQLRTKKHIEGVKYYGMVEKWVLLTNEGIDILKL